MKTIGINEIFTLQFISNVRDYEQDLILLKRMGFNPEYEDLNKESAAKYNTTFAEGRQEVIFNVPVKNVKQAALIPMAFNNRKTFNNN